VTHHAVLEPSLRKSRERKFSMQRQGCKARLFIPQRQVQRLSGEGKSRHYVGKMRGHPTKFEPWRLGGGRTRARTWDPMIKSHLLYQLSYAPGTGPESLRKRPSFSKATP
jgi:hypothetical protein